MNAEVQPPAKRAPKPRMTDKRLQMIRDDEFKKGYDSGRVDGFVEGAKSERTRSPFYEFFAGCIVGCMAGAAVVVFVAKHFP